MDKFDDWFWCDSSHTGKQHVVVEDFEKMVFTLCGYQVDCNTYPVTVSQPKCRKCDEKLKKIGVELK